MYNIEKYCMHKETLSSSHNSTLENKKELLLKGMTHHQQITSCLVYPTGQAVPYESTQPRTRRHHQQCSGRDAWVYGGCSGTENYVRESWIYCTGSYELLSAGNCLRLPNATRVKIHGVCVLCLRSRLRYYAVWGRGVAQVLRRVSC